MATKKKETKEAVELPGIVLEGEEPTIQLIWTPLGGGKWREQNINNGTDREVEGGIDATHNGQYIAIPHVTTDRVACFTVWDVPAAPVAWEPPDAVEDQQEPEPEYNLGFRSDLEEAEEEEHGDSWDPNVAMVTGEIRYVDPEKTEESQEEDDGDHTAGSE